jgi:protein-tyrosine phosphatase
LSFYLLDDDSSLFYDDNSTNIENVFSFVENAFAHYEACMIHSVRGKNRALFVAAAYLMRKYEWDAAFSIEVVSACRKTRMRAAFEQVCPF